VIFAEHGLSRQVVESHEQLEAVVCAIEEPLLDLAIRLVLRRVPAFPPQMGSRLDDICECGRQIAAGPIAAKDQNE